MYVCVYTRAIRLGSSYLDNDRCVRAHVIVITRIALPRARALGNYCRDSRVSPVILFPGEFHCPRRHSRNLTRERSGIVRRYTILRRRFLRFPNDFIVRVCTHKKNSRGYNGIVGCVTDINTGEYEIPKKITTSSKSYNEALFHRWNLQCGNFNQIAVAIEINRACHFQSATIC